MHPLRRSAVMAALAALILSGLTPAAPARAADPLLSQGRPATASSSEGAAWSAAAAVDGDTGTRWSSSSGDPQWLQVDLGAPATISRVVLEWEAAYGRSFAIQTSNDATTWTDAYATTTGTGGTQTIDLTATGRYVRLYGTARGTGYGYSLWELQVYGHAGDSWTDVWSDDFTGPAGASPSPANWIPRTGTSYPGGPANWGTGEVETMTAATANLSLDGAGHLTIKAIRDGAGDWTSARVETRRADFEPRPGELLRFSARLRQPGVANPLGYWPGFRATGAAYRGNHTNWPGIGETDIMTAVNGRHQYSATLHCGTAPAGCATSTTAAAAAWPPARAARTATTSTRRSSTAPGPTRRSASTSTAGRPGWCARARSAWPPGRPPCTTASTCGSTWPSAARCPTPSPGPPPQSPARRRAASSAWTG
ncbi:discoidin domain-containing protein [Nonomuraea thailandensis]